MGAIEYLVKVARLDVVDRLPERLSILRLVRADCRRQCGDCHQAGNDQGRRLFKQAVPGFL